MKPSVNIAFYRKEDWERFVKSADDKEKLHDTWEEWFIAFLSAKAALEEKNLSVKQVTIDVDELTEYCKRNKLKNTGKTRSEYVSKL